MLYPCNSGLVSDSKCSEVRLQAMRKFKAGYHLLAVLQLVVEVGSRRIAGVTTFRYRLTG